MTIDPPDLQLSVILCFDPFGKGNKIGCQFFHHNSDDMIVKVNKFTVIGNFRKKSPIPGFDTVKTYFKKEIILKMTNRVRSGADSRVLRGHLYIGLPD